MIESLFSLHGKTALVTGAGRGIGQQMALALAKAGAATILLARSEAALKETQQLINKHTDQPTRLVTADLLSVEHWTAFIEAHDLTQTDILCNVAGVNLREPAERISNNSWDTTLNLNLKVPFFLAQALVPHMKERLWGKVINIASLQSYRAFPNSIPYGAAKGGVSQLTRAMAEAWSKDGIGCNAIGPGFFPTELTQSVFDNPEIADRNANQTAIKRNGRMDDLDGLTIFLSSKASDYITGQTIMLDGGFTAK